MKNKKHKQVHSVAILPDGSSLSLPGCKAYELEHSGAIVIKNGGVTLFILPAGSMLITNWTRPNHA